MRAASDRTRQPRVTAARPRSSASAALRDLGQRGRRGLRERVDEARSPTTGHGWRPSRARQPRDREQQARCRRRADSSWLADRRSDRRAAWPGPSPGSRRDRDRAAAGRPAAARPARARGPPATAAPPTTTAATGRPARSARPRRLRRRPTLPAPSGGRRATAGASAAAARPVPRRPAASQSARRGSTPAAAAARRVPAATRAGPRSCRRGRRTIRAGRPPARWRGAAPVPPPAVRSRWSARRSTTRMPVARSWRAA